jgi:pimeloyl-ACP methyl ester carboxylesterase
MGNPTNPAIVLIHGYPTSSFDFARLADELSTDFFRLRAGYARLRILG